MVTAQLLWEECFFPSGFPFSFPFHLLILSPNLGQPQLEEELISEVAKLQSSLSKEQESCALLQHQVEHLLSRHSDELSAKDDVISQLNMELDAKASVIALVTQQLCQVRAKLKQEIEARSKKPSPCACPHCFVHRKMATSTEGRLSPLQEAECRTNIGRELVNTAGSKLLVPSPPSAIPSAPPHPPPPMAGRNRTIKRRASTPIRRQSPSPQTSPGTSLTNLSLDSSKERCLRPPHANKYSGTLSTEFLYLKDSVAKPVRCETHPILPPISAATDLDGQTAVNQNCRSYPGNHQILISPGSSDTSTLNARRRLILANSKGLNSAPSGLRVLHYGARNQHDSIAGGGGGGGGGTSGEEEEKAEEGKEVVTAPEGTLLLVKENDPGGMGPPQCAAHWTD